MKIILTKIYSFSRLLLLPLSFSLCGGMILFLGLPVELERTCHLF